MQSRIFEMEYSCSPGGIDCWELEINEGLGHSSNYTDFETAGNALNHLIRMYPDVSHEVDIIGLPAYYRSMGETYVISR
jgi:hypothetical protein